VGCRVWDGAASQQHTTLDPTAASQQHTTLDPTAGLPLKLSRVGPGRSLDGRPDAAGSGVGGAVGGTFASGLRRYPGSEVDIGCCLLDGMLNGCPDSLCSLKKPITYHKSKGVNPDVMTKFPTWSHSHHDHLITLPLILIGIYHLADVW
jgi:hypothetical protein